MIEYDWFVLVIARTVKRAQQKRFTRLKRRGHLQERNQLTLGCGLAGWVVRVPTADSAEHDAKEQS